MDPVPSNYFGTMRPTVLAIAILVVAPLVYLVVGQVMSPPARSGGEYDIMFYILLIVALVTPTFLPLIERFQIRLYRRHTTSRMSPEQLWVTVCIIKMALVESIYLFGLVVYLLSGDFLRLMLFYAIGVIWAAVYWPRQSQAQRFQQRLEAL